MAPGIYGDVALSEESGDLGGMELELIGSDADARVEFVICEGWCNAVRRAPAALTSEGFTFSYVEDYVDQAGRPVESRTFDAVVVRNGAGVTVTITPADAPEAAFTYELEPLDERFGLAVASAED